MYVINQLLQILLQLLSPLLHELSRFQVQIGQKILIRQFRYNITSIILDNLMMEELKIIESPAYDCIKPLETYFSCFYFIEFIAREVALLYQLGLIYDNLLPSQAPSFLSFSQLYSFFYLNPLLKLLFIILDSRLTSFFPIINRKSLAIFDRCCSSRFCGRPSKLFFHYFLIFIAI